MFIAIVCFFLPSLLGVPFRRMLGAKIGRGTKIKIFSLVAVNELSIGSNCLISSLAFIKSKKLSMQDNSSIKGPSILKANELKLGNYASISPLAVVSAPIIKDANLSLGDHSQIFPFCWLEPGEGIEIGNQVGIGGHTLIFTHGSWTNYLNGGPVSFGKVKIENGVWLPWRVFILPGVTIGENAIVAAHSTISKSVPARSLVGGNPAKVVKEDFVVMPDLTERIKRLDKLLVEFETFSSRCGRSESLTYQVVQEGQLLVEVNHCKFDFENLTYTNPENQTIIEHFSHFLRRYGIRLSKVN